VHETDTPGLNAHPRELLAAIVESSDDGIVSKTLAGIITSWNRAAERIFGYTAAEAIGRHITMLFPPDRISEETHFLTEISAGRRVEHFVTERVRKDGVKIPVSVSLSPIRDPGGVIIGASKIVRDVSDRARLERQATRAAAELDRILSAVGEGVAALDRDMRYAFVNDAAMQLVGMSREAVIGRTPAEVFPPDVVAQIEPHLQQALATGRVAQYEVHLPEVGRWFENRLYPSPDGLSVFFSDITARKRAEAALKESRDVLALAMRAGRMGAWSRNVVTGEVWWSRELEEIFGLDAGGFEGTEKGFFAFVHEDDRGAVQSAVEGAILSGHDYIVEFRFMHASGQVRWMEGRGRGAYAADGRPLSLHGIGIDITERKRVESQLAAARDAAEEANRAKDEFMAMLGHELRNPLSPILTALQLMKLRGGEGTERERTVIERQVAHLTRLVDDLLDVSRITRGKVVLRSQRVELAQVIAQAIEIASPLLEERSHLLELDVPASGLAVDADLARMAQVISNLLTNAAKYTPPGGTISVTGAREAGAVVVRVRDTGMGISREALPRIFDLFVQGPRAIDRGPGGLGLGLTIVKNLVEAHGGSVAAFSEGPDRGSEFVVTLPEAAPAPGALRQPAGDAAAPARVPDGQLRVLVVDDNVDAAEMLGAALRFRGFDVRQAYDGPAALDEAREFKPHAAFLDIGLPVMDGYELAGRLRDVPGLARVRLIAVTGYGQDSDRRRSADAGFEHHLVKPVNLDALEGLLADVGR
jgi:PAS domain S-box-containing protein